MPAIIMPSETVQYGPQFSNGVYQQIQYQHSPVQTAAGSPPRRRDTRNRVSQSVTNQPCQPTWIGVIEDDWDALLVVEACLQGKLKHCARRPHDHERPEMIKSGSIFVYNSMATGIKRWTDGANWSPSRMNGNCLLYRELERPFPPGKKKCALKRKRSKDPDSLSAGGEEENSRTALSYLPLEEQPSTMRLIRTLNSEEQRVYVGSLVDSYDFKNEGLFKKTVTISYRNIIHHVVSYYKLEDVFPQDESASLRFRRPRIDSFFQNITVRTELYSGQEGFRIQQLPMDAGEFRSTGFCPHYSAVVNNEFYNTLYSYAPVQQPMALGQVPQMVSFPQGRVDSVVQSQFGLNAPPVLPRQTVPPQTSMTAFPDTFQGGVFAQDSFANGRGSATNHCLSTAHEVEQEVKYNPVEATNYVTQISRPEYLVSDFQQPVTTGTDFDSFPVYFHPQSTTFGTPDFGCMSPGHESGAVMKQPNWLSASWPTAT